MEILRQFLPTFQGLEDTPHNLWLIQDGDRPHRTTAVLVPSGILQ